MIGLVPSAHPAHAAAVVVTSLVDDVGFCPSVQFCTLRTVLASAAPGMAVQFGVTGVFRLATPLLLSKNVTIQGRGAVSVVIDGQHQVRVFEIGSGAEVTMRTADRLVGVAPVLVVG